MNKIQLQEELDGDLNFMRQDKKKSICIWDRVLIDYPGIYLDSISSLSLKTVYL